MGDGATALPTSGTGASWGVLVDVLKVERHQLRIAEGGGEAHEHSALSLAPAKSGSAARPGVRQVVVAGQAFSTSSSSRGMSGAVCSGGAPLRRMPSYTVTTRAASVGSGKPRSRKANRIAGARRATVPTLAPALSPMAGATRSAKGPGVDDRGGASLSHPACQIHVGPTARRGTNEADDI